jgi:hypothetical protein
LKRVAAAVHRKELSPADAASDVIKALERERAAGSQPPVRPVVRPDDGPGGQPPPPAAEPPRAATVEEVPEDLTPTVPEASPEEAQSILQQLAKTMNVENNPQIVDDLPPAIQAALDRQKPPPALDFTQQPEAPAPTPEPRIGTRPYDPGANRPGAAIEWTDAPSGTTQSGTVIDQLPNGDLRVRRQDGKVRTVKPWEEPRTSAEESPGATLSAMLTRHDVRNPAKVKEIAASMKRVGWKGRPLLVVEDAGKETAWTGTHRLAAAREAGLSMEQVPQVRVSADKLRAAGYDVDELAALGKKKRVEALRKAGETEAADLLQEEIAAKAEREARPRPSPRAQGTSPRQQGTNPRAQAKTVADADRLLDEGNVDEAERLLSQQIEQRIQAALKHGTTPEKGGSTVYAGGFDPAAFRRLASKHPESAWKAVSSAIGGATGWYLDEDHPGRGILMGMAAGYGAGSMPRLVRALQQAEVSVGKGGRGGGVTPVRTARDASKDIGLFELVGGTPERTIPEQFEKARPAFEKFMRALHEEHRRTGQIIPQKRVQALRDRYVTPIITQIRKDAKVAQDAQHTYKARYITAFANRLAGHRTIGQRVVQAITKNKLPADFVERRIAGNVYYVGTGFALDTALQNTTQPLMALAHVPARYVVQAYRELASNPAAKRLVEGALLPLEKPADAIETTLGPFGSKLSKFRSSKVGRAVDPQNMLRWTDQKNREVVYYAARKFAEAKGLGTEAADQWARQVMRKTQAEPGALGTNPFHAGPVAGSLRPFTKYPTVFTEHLVDLLKQVGQGENLGGAARFAGSLAVLSLLGQQFGIDAEDLLISGGRPLGIDPQHPGRSLERLVSGMGTPATRGVSDVMKHITGGADHSLAEDLPDIAVPRYARKLKDAVTQFAGDKDVHITRGAGGKVRDVATPGETILNLLGLRTERQTERRHALADFYETATAASDSYKANRQQAYDRLGAALDAGDEEAARATIREIGSAAAVRSFLKRRNMLPEERFYRTLPPKVRQTVRGAFEEAQALAPEGAR